MCRRVFEDQDNFEPRNCNQLFKELDIATWRGEVAVYDDSDINQERMVNFFNTFCTYITAKQNYYIKSVSATGTVRYDCIKELPFKKQKINLRKGKTVIGKNGRPTTHYTYRNITLEAWYDQAPPKYKIQYHYKHLRPHC